MTLRVLRDEKWYKTHVIDADDVIKHGMEKACILGNTDKLYKMDFKDLYKRFPYIQKDKFYQLLSELEKDGYIEIEK